MRKFLIKLAFFILPPIIILVLSEIFINNFLNNNSFYKINDSSNILILGNSHSECALNDSVIDHSINLSNAADCYFYTYYKLKKIIEANPNIHTLILEYTNIDFSKEMDIWLYGEKYLVCKYPKYSHLISIQDKMFLFHKNPGAYFNACKDALMEKVLFLFDSNIQAYKKLDWGGYLYLERNEIPKIKKEFQKSDVPKSNSISTFNIVYLKKIVNYCKANNIKLIFFRSPLHILYKRCYETELTNLLKKDFYNITFWDYSNYSFEDYEYGDLEHLNYKGAKRFSKVINLRLNQDSKSIQE